MKRVLIRCDGARVPVQVEREHWDEKESIGHRGDSPDLNINILAPQSAFDRVDGVVADLLRIAAYAFAADQQVSRGGVADVYGDAWRRDFTLYLPVSDVRFWGRADVAGAVEAALSYVSDDRWRFVFVAEPSQDSPSTIGLSFESSETMGNPDVVCLFSGGLDSLCSVVEQACELGRRPVLVGHSPAFHVGPRHRALYRELRQHLNTWSFPYVSGAVHRLGSDARETSQRTRSFLYAALGVTVAAYLGIKDVQLSDNGVVSLNLPVNQAVLGAQATRSTHPKFIRLFNRLLQLVLPDGPRVSNPLWSRTRAETLDILRRARLAHVIPTTNSCAHQRGRTRSQPYCGVCSQCIDRRYAMVAAGLEKFDPSERYEVDIFTDALPDGTKRAMAYSYYAFAKDVATMSDEDLLIRYPFAECIDPLDPEQARIARDLVGVVKRHGQSVVQVLMKQLREHEEDLALQRLPDSCLLALVASQRAIDADQAEAGTRPRAPAPSFLQSEDLQTVTVDGVTHTVTKSQGAVVHRLKLAMDRGLPDVAWIELRRTVEQAGGNPDSMRDVFKDRVLRDCLIKQVQKGVYRLNLDP